MNEDGHDQPSDEALQWRDSVAVVTFPNYTHLPRGNGDLECNRLQTTFNFLTLYPQHFGYLGGNWNFCNSHACLSTIMMQRPPNIETERLLLVALVPEDIEALIAGDLERVSLLTGFTFLPEDPKLGADLSWHLKGVAGRQQPAFVAHPCHRRAVFQHGGGIDQLEGTTERRWRCGDWMGFDRERSEEGIRH